MHQESAMKKKLIRCSIAVALCLFIGFLSSAATGTSLSGWFANLDRPFFSPSKWIIGTAWILGYFLIGISAGLVWSKGFYHKWVKVALYHFGFLVILTSAWPILFFGLQSTLLGLLNSLALLILVLYTVKWARIVSDTAAYVLYPYAAWVIFVLVLNFETWRLNM